MWFCKFRLHLDGKRLTIPSGVEGRSIPRFGDFLLMCITSGLAPIWPVVQKPRSNRTLVWGHGLDRPRKCRLLKPE